MLYPFMTLPDETEIVHSESMMVDDKEKVKVCIEKPVDYGFKSATCWLPDYQWEKIEGFTQEEIDNLQEMIQSLAATIYELAREGGFEHAEQLFAYPRRSCYNPLEFNARRAERKII